MRVETFSPPYVGPSDAEVSAAQAVLDAREQGLAQVEAGTLITCTTDSKGRGCGHRQPINESAFYQTHWYVEPHGCTGGDYWRAGEGQFRCNSCSKLTRLYDSEDITSALHRHAKSKEDVYAD